MADSLFLAAAFVASVVSMGWLALSLDAHWRHVYDGAPSSTATIKRLRVTGALGLGVSLALCLSVDHASMASLVWVMSVAAGALIVAFTLTWHPRFLRPLCPRAGGAE